MYNEIAWIDFGHSFDLKRIAIGHPDLSCALVLHTCVRLILRFRLADPLNQYTESFSFSVSEDAKSVSQRVEKKAGKITRAKNSVQNPLLAAVTVSEMMDMLDCAQTT